MRYYGLKLNDRVHYKAFSWDVYGQIIYLYPTDNNRGRMKCDDGEEIDVVCEWCKKI